MRVAKRFLIPALVGTVVFSATVSRAEMPTIAQRYRALFADKISAAGMDADAVFASPATITVYGSDGSVQRYTRSFGEVVDNLAPSIQASVTQASGPAGTPEYVAGNITEIFGSLWAGSTSEAAANCQSVSVKQSSVVPDTYAVASAAGYPAPFVPVTLAPLYLTPVPGALSPVIPASSWALPAYAWLGPTLHIKARYTLGLHEVGTLIGSNVSTASGAPSPYPVWAPMATLGFLADHSMDFLGQGLFIHAEVRTDLFGYTACGGLGTLLLSNGTAIFDNHKVLGADIGFPDLP